MKLILILLTIILPPCLVAQDCKIKRNTDPFTKEIRLSTGLINLDGASLAVEADSKEIDFFFSAEGKEACFNDASSAAVSFEGTKVKATYRNGGTVNCEGFFHIIFRNTAGTPSNLQRLISQKIATIVITGSGKTKITVTLSPEDQEKVMKMADCLVKEAKTLIK